jgi:Fe-S-cluster containining protein
MGKFYKNGLYFQCTLCGECCRHTDGKVEITSGEVSEIAGSLRITPEEFLGRYCHPLNGSIELTENEQGHCIFLLQDRCTIYDSRPLQCRTFPFWPENLKSHYRWKQLRLYCPGIDRGEWHCPETIRKRLGSQKRSKE